MNDISIPGTGLMPRVPVAGEAALFGYEAADPAYDWSKVFVDDADPQPYVFGIPDKDQNGSGSCTCQTAGYGFFKGTGIDISREDPYSHVALPGGGAYLDAPYWWLDSQGYLPLDEYPDPNPESEAAMTKIITVVDGKGRVKKFRVTSGIIRNISIDVAAAAIDAHTFVCLGIAGSWQKGWEKSWTDPYYVQNNWQHALMCGQAVMRKGKKAIKAKSSWCQHKDFLGQPCYAHFINEDYFNAGGVFEILAVDIKEITDMEQHFKVNIGGRAGLFHVYGDGGWFEVAANEQDYHDMGVKYHVDTCDLVNGKWVFQPFDFQK